LRDSVPGSPDASGLEAPPLKLKPLLETKGAFFVYKGQEPGTDLEQISIGIPFYMFENFNNYLRE
uniref:hypothetical protein n=1 Tax=Salinimicrobium xinjiangense TaxID=438596 RepID=UPI0005658AAD